MTPENFCYWLQGYFELRSKTEFTLTQDQVEEIKNHLQLVFRKETPFIGDSSLVDFKNWPQVSC